MAQALLALLAYATATILLGWLYFHRYTMRRPPIGVFNLWDIGAMLAAIILLQYLLLALPRWLLAGLLGLGTLSLLYMTLEPVLRARWLLWYVVIGLLVTDWILWLGSATMGFPAINNLVQVLAVLGVANLWAQGGMRARDAALLGACLAVYDWLFTAVLPLMGDLFSHLEGLPFAPLLAWPPGNGGPLLALGLGDLLLATVFPLVIYKAYGRRAGLGALLTTTVALVAVLTLPALGLLVGIFPVMAVLGPLMPLQYLYWRRGLGPERTMWQHLKAAEGAGNVGVQRRMQ